MPEISRRIFQAVAAAALGMVGFLPATASAADPTEAIFAMANRAREACLAKGYAVTVSVVGTDGQPIVVLRGDGAPIHTIVNSFDKAYTVMTLGPLKKLDSSSALEAEYRRTPSVSYALAVTPLPHINFGAGAVLVRIDGRLIGGLGVSGSNGGDIDEVCAREGISDVP